MFGRSDEMRDGGPSSFLFLSSRERAEPCRDLRLNFLPCFWAAQLDHYAYLVTAVVTTLITIVITASRTPVWSGNIPSAVQTCAMHW